MRKKLLLLIMAIWALSVPMFAQTTLTVCDGSTTNEYVPFYGWYADAYTKSQFIFPATDITPMAGNGTITGMTFYASGSNSWGSATWNVYLMETSLTTFGYSYESIAGATLVYSGAMNLNGGVMDVVFTNNYVYGGSNLMVCFEQQTIGTYSSCYFNGMQSNGSSLAGYGYGSAGAASSNQQNFLPKTTFTYIAGDPNYCFPPLHLAVSNITTTTADIAWNAGNNETNWSLKWGTKGFDVETEGTLVASITDSTYVLTGLSAGVKYDVYVRANCTATSNYSNWVKKSFKTLTLSATVPYVTDFSNATDNGQWDITDGSTMFYIGSDSLGAACYSQGGALYISDDNGLTYEYGASAAQAYAVRRINFTTAGNYVVSYRWKSKGDANESYKYDFGRAFLAPGDHTLLNNLGYGALYDDWFCLDNTFALNGSESWQVTNAEFQITVPGEYQLIFYWNNNGYDTYNPPLAVDDVSVTALTCPAPVNFAATAIDTAHATLEWTENGSATAWTVEYGVADFVQGTGTIVDVTNTTCTLSGLIANQRYDAYVKSNCSATDNSNWTKCSFRTSCPTYQSVPYFEDFESYDGVSNYYGASYNVLPTCWDYVNNSTGSYSKLPLIYHYSEYAHSGTNLLYSYVSYDSYDHMTDIYAVLPAFNNINTLQVSFWGRMGYSYNAGRVYVGVINGNDGTTFEPVDTIDFVSASYNEYIVYLDSYTGTNHNIAFCIPKINNEYNYVYIDDITVSNIPSCKNPTNLRTVSVGDNIATITWDDPNGTAPASYTVEYGFEGFTIGNGAQMTVTTNSAELTNLVLLTSYDVYVKTNCDATENSQWVGPLNFTCGEVVVGSGSDYNYTVGWNNYYRHSWSQNIYLASEIGRPGLITSVFFYVGAMPSGGYTFNTADIYMAETDIESYQDYNSCDWIPLANQAHVYSATALNINQLGWMEFVLDEPFFYSGEHNLAISLSKSVSEYNSQLTWRYTAFNSYMALAHYSDSESNYAQHPGTSSGNAENNRIDVKLLFGDASSYCAKPAGLGLVSNGITDATIGWETVNGESAWTLGYGPVNFDIETQGTLITGIDTTVYTLTNLTDSTTYDVYVKSVCSDTTSSNWAGPFTFTTLPACAAPTNFRILSSNSSSVTLGWIPGYTETQWVIEYDSTGFTQGTGIVITVNNDPTAIVSNLVEGATYDFYIRSVCDAMMSSVWNGPITKTIGELSIGEGTESYEYLPFYGYYGYGYSQQIYLASEMDGPCMISAIKFYCTSTPSGSTGANKIWMGNVSKTSFANAYDYVDPADLSLVYDMGNGVAWNVQPGWNTFILDEPFVYDGFSSLLIAFYEGYPGYSSAEWMCHSTSTNMSVMHYNDTQSNVSYTSPSTASGSTSFNKRRSNIKLIVSAVDPNYCFMPTKITANVVDTATVIANWVTTAPSSTIIWGEHGFDVATAGTTVTLTDTTYTFTGLTSNTLYDMYIRSNCSDVNSSTLKGPISFRTLCGTYTSVPFFDDFESWMAVASYYNNEENNLPDCWNSLISFEDPSLDYGYEFPYIMSESGYAYSGNNALLFYPYQYSGYYSEDYGEQYAILPPFNNVSGLQVEFWGKSVYDSYQSTEGTVVIGVMTDPTSVSTFVPVDTISLSNDVFTYHIIYMSQYSGNGNYIAFMAPYASAGVDANEFYIDDIKVDVIPDCPPVTSLNVIGIDTVSATLGWTENGNATAWEIEYGPIGYTEGQGTLVQANSNPFTITGLTPSTGYQFNVRPACGGNWSVQPKVFYTAQTPASLPYSCGFEANDPESSKWTLENGNETNRWFIGQDMFNYGHYSGQQGLYISYEQYGAELGTTNYYYFSAASKVYAYRAFDLEAGSYVVSFRWKAAGEEDFDYLRVFLAPTSSVLSAGNSNGITSTTTPDGWIAIGGELNGVDDWQYYYNEDITITESGFYNLVFYWTNDASNGNYPAPAIDDVQMFAMTCPLPASATCTATDATTATISWVEQGEAAQWNIEYGTRGFTQGSGTVVNTTSNPYTITGLSPLTEYDAYVQSVCGADDMSGWRGPVQFATAGCETYEMCPITLVLTDQNPDGWMGNKVTVFNGPNLVDEYTMYSGVLTKTYSIPLCPGEVSFKWTLGAFPNECGIIIIDNAGDTIYTCADGSTLADGSTFFSFTHACEAACDGPTNLAATQTATGVALTWTAAEGISSYSVYRNNVKIANNVTATNYNDVVTTNGSYCYKVASNCENGGESQPSNEACLNTTISVSENAAESANIYPNPTNNKVKIEAAGITRIEVMSIVGQHIYSTEVEADEFEFDFAQYEAGVYMMHIETTTGSATKRVTVVK